MSGYFIGVDGGGTSCRVALADEAGHILGRAKGGAANILTDPQGALVSIVATAREAVANACVDIRLEDTAAFLGLAGANVGDGTSWLMKRLPFGKAYVDSDGLIALQGAFGNGDGVAAIVGTGSIYITRHKGATTYKGGWGFAGGDLGGGARLGQSLLQECLLVHDGIRQGSALVSATLGGFDDDPRKLVAFAHDARPGDFGRFAPAIFGAAEHGDRVALRLLRQAASAVDEALDAAVQGSGNQICLLGGLAPLYPRWLAERHRERLVEPLGDALSGAVSLAISSFMTEAH